MASRVKPFERYRLEQEPILRAKGFTEMDIALRIGRDWSLLTAADRQRYEAPPPAAAPEPAPAPAPAAAPAPAPAPAAAPGPTMVPAPFAPPRFRPTGGQFRAAFGPGAAFAANQVLHPAENPPIGGAVFGRRGAWEPGPAGPPGTPRRIAAPPGTRTVEVRFHDEDPDRPGLGEFRAAVVAAVREAIPEAERDGRLDEVIARLRDVVPPSRWRRREVTD
jgi:hypothetical protein